MTPDAIAKMQEEASRYFDKPNGTMSAQRALTMMWALRAAGLEVKMATACSPKGENLARKVCALTQQIIDSSNGPKKAEVPT